MLPAPRRAAGPSLPPRMLRSIKRRAHDADLRPPAAT